MWGIPSPDPMQANRPPLIRELGRADYEPVFAAMRAFTDARTPDTPDELWIVEHPPVFTLGLGADRGHLLPDPACRRTTFPWCRPTAAAK
jgi:lipoate-protein ligase B